jgi:hypothetical protein
MAMEQRVDQEGQVPARREAHAPWFWPVLYHLCRLVLAFVYLASGALKALDPQGFGAEVARYGLLQGTVATVFAYTLIPLELAVGAALLLDYRGFLGFPAGACLMVMFIGAVGFAIATDQPLEGCGCFGRNVHRTPAQTIVEDLGFLAAGLLGLIAGRRQDRATGPRSPRRWKAATVTAVLLSSSAFVAASPHLPIDNVATALRPGVTWEELGVTLPDVALSKGTHVVAVMGMTDEASAEALPALNALAADGTSVVGLYDDGEEAYSQFFWNLGPAFPLHYVAPTDLKQLYRRRPRFFALREGVVIATWTGRIDASKVRAVVR